MEARKIGRSETRGFVLLRSYYDAIKDLPDDQRLAIVDVIFRYVFEGEEPSGLSPVMRGYFILLKPNIDASAKKYAAQRENGAKGGRPQKPKDNPAETQPIPNQYPAKTQPKPNHNQESESESESESETDTEKEYAAGMPPSTPTGVKPKRNQYGQYGWVKLSDQEYSRLSNDLGEAELKRCIAYVDESAQSTGNKNRWKDWNLVLRKCSRQGWGLNTPQERAFAYTPRPECVPDEDY